MKAVNMLLGLALFLIGDAQSARLNPAELEVMYHDPEYADTWRYTNDQRYVEEDQWTKDAPSGYKDHMFKDA